MKISLILPTFNVEDYLASCLTSCVKQDLSINEYEIIVVIDGSQDGSRNIALRFAKDYSNIVIIDKSNGGLSDARNVGLENAKGEIVWFIDSDDYIEPNILKSIYLQFQSDKLDCLWIKWRNVDLARNILPFYEKVINNELVFTMSGLNFMRKVLASYMPAWSFIYNKTFLLNNSLRFTKGMYYEDVDFAFRSLPSVKKIKLFPYICYNYLQRPGSIIRNTNEKIIIDICINAQNAFFGYKHNNGDTELQNFYCNSFSAFFLFALKHCFRVRDKRYLIILDKYIEQEHWKGVKAWGSFANRFLAFSYNVFGWKVIRKILKVLCK